MLCIFMQMFILFVYGRMLCVINNMVECCDVYTFWANNNMVFVYFHADVYTFCVVYFHADVFMVILFVSLTIWLNVVYFHADVYTFCVINNMVECCVFSCRCLFLCFIVSITIWTNVVLCVINNMVECCVFSCRCLYFLCH